MVILTILSNRYSVHMCLDACLPMHNKPLIPSIPPPHPSISNRCKLFYSQCPIATWMAYFILPPPLTYARRPSYATAPNAFVVIVDAPSMMQTALNACAVKRCSIVAFSHYPVSDPYFPSSIIHIIFSDYLTTYRFTGQGRCTDLIC
jgi:hypothetical protein